ncbi:RICIN domain-containing protein [Kitasatospora viridis]|uniref:Ricin-type beta-trefoil lectin protein n=1 Tax=Kitasatospora viridis TaxID=281105 RepID=A0A561TSQ9_9ACTN|nr:RICIN domain-containing protein [Kitasatospora viridis]TWF90127.1 ricin-type beta-trefoil lectin protein [Kitasatospora viridis]
MPATLMRKLFGTLAATALALTAAGLTTTASAATATAPAAHRATATTGSSPAGARALAAHALDGTHTLVTGGMAVDDPNGSTGWGTRLITYGANGGSNQNWQFIPQPDGSYTLRNGASNLCAEVNGGSVYQGAVVDQWQCANSANVHWLLTPLSNGSFIVSSMVSGLALTASSTGSGATLTQQAYTNSPLQQWTIGMASPVLSGSHNLVTGGLALNDPGNGTVTTATVNGSAYQNWQFLQQPDSTYEVVSGSTGQCLNAPANSGTVNEDSCNDGPLDHWTVTTVANGSFTLISSTGQLLASNGNGATAALQSNSNSSQQQWTTNWVNPALTDNHTLVNGSLALADPESSQTAGTEFITWRVNGNINQSFHLVQQIGGYQLVNDASNLCVEMPGQNITPGLAADQSWCSLGTNMLWVLTPLANGSYLISSAYSGLQLTATTTSGATVTQQINSGSPQQQWTIS